MAARAALFPETAHVLETLGWDVRECRQDGSRKADLWWKSPIGRECHVDTGYEDERDFLESFERHAEDFDPDDYATGWMFRSGKPHGIRDLIDDAGAIGEHLKAMARALCRS